MLISEKEFVDWAFTTQILLRRCAECRLVNWITVGHEWPLVESGATMISSLDGTSMGVGSGHHGGNTYWPIYPI